ncbi:MAG TPA: lytic transglycosylase domain-containing protein [Thermoanaerobaculia bacterium]|nr:lytic transglycosylase domain-containing protein [Thermoanaerobaculia bacterium]
MLSNAFAEYLVKAGFVIAVTLVVTATLGADERKFSASAVPNARLKKPGRVVISNDHRAITAYRFFGNIREALVSLRSTRRFAVNPFGPAVFNASASPTAPAQLTPMLQEAARTHGVDARLLAAVAHRESAWNPRAVSRTGACGLMQLMPATAQYLGVRDVFDPRENIFGGARYLRTLLDAFDGDLDLALAAYNAGPGAVEKYRGVPPYRETKAYVAAVKASYETALRAQ